MDSISFVWSIGGVDSRQISDPFAERENIASNPVKTYDAEASQKMIEAIDAAKATGDTLGGVVECVVRNTPPGIGSHVQWDRKLDGLITQAVMSIQAVKAVEIGRGHAGRRKGSEEHDPIIIENGKLTRSRNNAGGIEGGISNGEPIVVRAAMKPISTLMQPLQSINLATGEPEDAHIERSDVCAVPALSVIVEQIVALTIASELLETFGGDTVSELSERIEKRREAMHIKSGR
jgi:chorismate synthase